MSPLQALAPDQRAILELLLRQGRSYAELAELLGLPEAGVRSRAHAALAALVADRPAPIGEDGAVADWILGQQDGEEADRTGDAIARMPAWHAWATDVTDRLGEVDGAEVPDVPDPEDDTVADPRNGAEPAARPRGAKPNAGGGRSRAAKPNAGEAAGGHSRGAKPVAGDAAGGRARARGETGSRRPRPVRAAAGVAAGAESGAGPRDRDAEPAAKAATATGSPPGGSSALRRLPSSRVGGALLIGLLALLVAGGLYLIFSGGDEAEQPAADANATATPAATPEVVNEVALQGVGNKSQGLMRVFRRTEDGRLVFALAADKMPANKAQEVYAVWFTRPGSAPRILGFSQSQVGKEGVFTTGGPQQGQEIEFAKWLVDYEKVVVARAGAQTANAKKPGEVVLQGTLPGGQE